MAQVWRVLWTARVGGVEAMALDGGRLYVATPGEVAAFDEDGGRPAWVTDIEGDGVTLAVGDGVVVHRSSAGTNAFDTATGGPVPEPEGVPQPVDSERPAGVTFENDDDGLRVVDDATGETLVTLPVDWPGYEPGPLLFTGDRAYTGLADGRLVCLVNGDGAGSGGPPSVVLDGLSTILTGVGRGLGSAEDDRAHQAALTRWLVEEVAGVKVDEDMSPREVVAALDAAHAAAGTPPVPSRDDVPDGLGELVATLRALVDLVAGGRGGAAAHEELVRLLVFEPPAGVAPSELAWSGAAAPAAQEAFASGIRAAVDAAGVDPEALPPFTGDRAALSSAVARAIFAGEESMRDPLRAALRAADGIDGWEGGAFADSATGDWDEVVALASADEGDRLQVRYPQLLDTTAAVLAETVIVRQALARPGTVADRLAALRASGEALLGRLASPDA